jgi:beta-glucanase (GH16 family)
MGCLLRLSVAAQGTTGWTLAWADEFNQPDGSSPDTTRWTYDLGAGGWGNNEWQYYTSRTNNIRIENGCLVIEARQENYQGSSYTSARLKTQGKAAWAYGRIEARMKIPRTQGIWPAFWMLGTNITSAGWPTCGEIDIMENIGREPTTVHGTVHGPGYSGGSGIGGPYSLPGNAPFADDFHVYAVEWTTNQIKWFVDGQQYFSVTPASLPAGSTWVFTQPQFLLLNVAVGGNWPGYPDGTTVFPQRMAVDYVRVYAPSNLTACADNLLVNPGFENGGLANWSVYGAGFNTLLENSASLPVHDGSNVFKVFGQFTGTDNYSGVYQDSAVSPGQRLAGEGWALTPSGDVIAGDNSAWLEVSFRDNANNILRLYRSAPISSNSPAGAWLKLAITNELNPANYTGVGTVTNLVAPANSSVVRFQVVFRQPATATGAVLFDDLKLAAAEAAERPVRTSAILDGNQLNLVFETFLSLPYQVRWKTNLSENGWTLLTNIAGTGSVKTVAVALEPTDRFFQVLRLCN